MAISKEEVLEYIGNLSVLELSELVKAFEEKFGVSAAPTVVAGAVAAGGGAGGAEEKTEFKEEHFVEEVGNGYKLSGQADLYNAEQKMVTDYKTCSCWKVIYNDWEDYRKQLLMYAWAFRKMGFEVDK